MDYLDLDSFRSKYSDITVTAVPVQKSNPSSAENSDAIDRKFLEMAKELPPHVEIIPIGPRNGASTSAALLRPLKNKQVIKQQQKETQDALAYANEYKQVLAKLEYTKYVQAQLQMMSTFNGIGANKTEPNKTTNIVDSYNNLLNMITEMQKNLGPTTIGLRAPKDRLLRDITQARVLVKECTLLLMRDQQQSYD